ncbi:MAG TPA: redoxin domain-containing protein [Armatimonadota bacterium]
MKIGETVPDLTFDVFQNEEIKKLSFQELRGKWVAVLFYPADFTFVCPTELQEAAQLYSQFKDLGAELISASTDTAYVHKAWHDESPAIKTVEFPMAADPSGALSRAFGVYLEGEGLALRGSFIIDPDGVLQCYEVNNLPIGRSTAELLRKLQAAQFVREHGEVCPAGWKPGAKTLKPGLDLVGKI